MLLVCYKKTAGTVITDFVMKKASADLVFNLHYKSNMCLLMFLMLLLNVILKKIYK